ncbi:hypothetical protein ACHAXT_006000 [Thalassiosira profunda]
MHRLPLKQCRRPPRRRAAVAVAAATSAGLGLSVYTRRLRDEKLSTLTPARESDLLSTSSTSNANDTIASKKQYNLPHLVETVTRAGLVGSTKSVKDEVHALRQWHASRGYNGGIVVRDLSRPLFSLDASAYAHEAGTDEEEELESADGDHGSASNDGKDIDIDRTNRRECYYLYYEIHSDGETRQQIFCRGTTLLADVLTCLQAWFVHDAELGCRVHRGFNEHANRIVEDVLPLLVPPATGGDGRRYATVELCGHSLGGAVAMLVAIKLRKRGYVVTRVTSLAGPRFCRGPEEREILQKWLPRETIRIEDDLDLVTYLPPSGVSVGDKLWLAKGGSSYMLPKDSLSRANEWTEAVWLNLRLVESIVRQNTTHRVTSYVKRLEQLREDIDNNYR